MSRLGLAALLLLAGCSEDAPLPPERPDAEAVTKVTTVALPKRLELNGRWAIRPDMCETGWWDFGGDEIVTAGELACSIAGDERTATSATLHLSCIGEGIPTTETWRIKGDDGRIAVTRDEAAPIDLVKCGS